MASTVTQKGQVTIPVGVRVRLGLVPGNSVIFDLDPDGRVVLRKVGADLSPSKFNALRGRAGKGMTTDEVMALTRGDLTR